MTTYFASAGFTVPRRSMHHARLVCPPQAFVSLHAHSVVVSATTAERMRLRTHPRAARTEAPMDTRPARCMRADTREERRAAAQRVLHTGLGDQA